MLVGALLAAGSAQALEIGPRGGIAEKASRWGDYVPGPALTGNPSEMKKAPATRAEDAFNYSVAIAPEEPYTAYSFKNWETGQSFATGTAIWMGFEINPDDVKALQGGTITAVNITGGITKGGSSVQGIKKVKVFISRDLKNADYIQEATLNTEALGLTNVTLETPYEITGDGPIYIGYRFLYNSNVGYFAPVDGIPTSQSGFIIGFVKGSNDMPTNFMQDVAIDTGSLCVSATVEGATLPADRAAIVQYAFPQNAKAGGDLAYKVNVVNLGGNEMNTFTVKTAYGDGKYYHTVVNLPQPLPYKGASLVDIVVPAPEESMITTVTTSIFSVNDVEVEEPVEISGSVTFISNDDGFPRVAVCEEGTGNWCGFCPAGIVMMEYMKEKYPDNIVRIAVHGGNGGNEPMTCTAYNGWLNAYVSGFPFAMVNRNPDYAFIPSSYDAPQLYQIVDAIMEEVTGVPAYAKITLEGTCDADDKNVEAVAKVEFGMKSDTQHLLSFVVVEDNVGPYRQSNYFSGENIDMGGWEKKGSSEKMKYEDVARNLVSYPGIANSLPKVTTPGEVYEFSTSVNIENVTNKNFRLVALLTNSSTGEIVNAAQVDVEMNSDPQGVEGVYSEGDVTVKVADGVLSVEGATEVAVYSLDGRLVSTAAESQLPAGIYLVKADSKVVKVIL